MSLVKSKVDFETYTEADKIVDELLEKYYDKHYDSFEEFQKDVFEKIEKAHKDIEEGRGIPMEVAVEEMRVKYGIRI